MTKKTTGMPTEIVIIRVKTGAEKLLPFATALKILKRQVGKHVSKHYHKVGKGFEFNGTDIVRVKDEK